MKIGEFGTRVVGNPPPHIGGRYFISVKGTTDNGIEGSGEVYAATFGPHVVVRMIEDVRERNAVGAGTWGRAGGRRGSRAPVRGARPASRNGAATALTPFPPVRGTECLRSAAVRRTICRKYVGTQSSGT